MLREYRCGHCGQEFEVITPADAPPEKPCIYCNHGARLVIYSPGSFTLRGAGWASDGYARKQ